MTGHRNFEELRAKMSLGRRARNDAVAKQMTADLVPSEIRKLAGLTQVQAADAMGVSQSALSQLENQDDMYVSTL